MKFTTTHNIQFLATLLNCKVKGDKDQCASGINEIHMVEHGDIVFVDHPKYYQKALLSAATIIIIPEELLVPEGKSLLVHPKPFDAFNFLLKHFAAEQTLKDAWIHVSAKVYPNVYLGKNVRIEENCVIHAGAHIADHTHLESGVIIGPNSVIGYDAFYYKKKPEGYDRLNSSGGVHIESNVEIGALCTIDRGVTGVTRIGKGTKIDNQVHIGHDTQIGTNTLIAAGCGISGCVEIGNNVTIWGQVGMASGVKVHDNAVILGQSGVTKNVPEGAEYFGTPAGPSKDKYTELVYLRNQVKN
ncbi:MAG: UDP-3-O-(3-hydroxymyristoyl)glucosamine N-acyltransferase [Crocinitomicaceae bacterium]|jgi:UDP-3-O-[3-hydroxymyristoyl] glucosamine N-acyltransferase|nr:UDP-3-O-(3-hydroxymyristoyl)glucosamine N-acyltransferase [Crocinitomicaceae bacterium]MDP4760910.1 UDP-3-O-(3-hydroxymyristoyl)glucosamine N-acyltransferase [Crocinitomicaceae bacterium]